MLSDVYHRVYLRLYLLLRRPPPRKFASAYGHLDIAPRFLLPYTLFPRALPLIVVPACRADNGMGRGEVRFRGYRKGIFKGYCKRYSGDAVGDM